MSKIFKATEVAEHKKPDSLWIIVEGDVYDVTKFQNDHPGGKKILQRVGGKDATAQFWKYHNEGILKKYKTQLQIGSLEGKVAPPPEPKKEEPKKEEQVVLMQAGPVAPAPTSEVHEAKGKGGSGFSKL